MSEDIEKKDDAGTKTGGTGVPGWLIKLGVVGALIGVGLAKLGDNAAKIGGDVAKLSDNTAKLGDIAKIASDKDSGEVWADFLSKGYTAYDWHSKAQSLTAKQAPDAFIEYSYSATHEVSTFQEIEEFNNLAYECVWTDSALKREVVVNGIPLGRIGDDDPHIWGSDEEELFRLVVTRSSIQEDNKFDSKNPRYFVSSLIEMEGGRLVVTYGGEVRIISGTVPGYGSTFELKNVQFTYTPDGFQQIKEQIGQSFSSTLEEVLSDELGEVTLVGYDYEMSNPVLEFDGSGKPTVREGPSSFRAAFGQWDD